MVARQRAYLSAATYENKWHALILNTHLAPQVELLKKKNQNNDTK